jgi:hypothetical protein
MPEPLKLSRTEKRAVIEALLRKQAILRHIRGNRTKKSGKSRKGGEKINEF